MTAQAGPIHDFHSHTFLSDGELSPVELIRRAAVAGYVTLGITDHCGIGDLQRIIGTLKADRDAVRAAWPEIEVFVGVELTHLPRRSSPRRPTGRARRGPRSSTSTARRRSSRPRPAPTGRRPTVSWSTSWSIRG